MNYKSVYIFEIDNWVFGLFGFFLKSLLWMFCLLSMLMLRGVFVNKGFVNKF